MRRRATADEGSSTRELPIGSTEVARRLGVSRDTIWRWTRDGTLTKGVHFGHVSTKRGSRRFYWWSAIARDMGSPN